MNFILKIEELLNKLILAALAWLKSMVPSFISKKYYNFKLSFKRKVRKLKIKCLRLAKSLLETIKKWNEVFFRKADFFKDFPFKEKLSEFHVNSLFYLKSNPKKKVISDFFKAISSLFLRVFSNPKFVKSFIFVLVFGLGVATYKTIKLANTPSRSIASTISKIKRPEYKKYQRRTLKVMNVSIPVIIKNKSDIHSLLTDFYVRTDTVFAKLYLDHNQHKIRDRFYENTYRMPASFPLDNDGKRVIKEKIALELNQLLKDNKVEGKVLEISLDAPIAN